LFIFPSHIFSHFESIETLANREALRISPQDADAHYNLGILLAEQERAEEAEKAYSEALRINPRTARRSPRGSRTQPKTSPAA